MADTPLHKVFPIFTPIAKILGKDVDGKNTDERESLIGDEERGHNKKDKKKKKKEHHHEEGAAEKEEEGDPLNYLGFGMVAYRDLMFTMFWLFAVLSLIMTPVMMFYK